MLHPGIIKENQSNTIIQNQISPQHINCASFSLKYCQKVTTRLPHVDVTAWLPTSYVRRVQHIALLPLCCISTIYIAVECAEILFVPLLQSSLL